MRARFFLALTLVVAGVVIRVVPHPWNFAPIGAIALFAGAHFDRRSSGFLIPLIAMFCGDTLLEIFTRDQGYHSLMGVVYATYALIAVAGIAIRDKRTSPFTVGLTTIGASVLFFITTNFANWIWSPLYAKTIDGLVACYIAAIPFFGNTLASDAIFTAILFGTFAIAERRVPMFAPVRG
jgi:hypothetical protein